eukprot:gene27795-34570_t
MVGSLHLDWPICLEKPTAPESIPRWDLTFLLFRVLDMISDMRDSVFFVGLEISQNPWHLPFPILTGSPDFHSSDIPYPWIETVFLNQALLRPDLIEARWVFNYNYAQPWHPLSNESYTEFFKHIAGHPFVTYNASHAPMKPMRKSQVGHLRPLKNLFVSERTSSGAGKYKYMVVLNGINARAASARLASFLAYSGAVILLQHSEFEYHFSARLKPWVHYVPLTYSAADIVEKIEWLKAHDKEAQQIATNARNFGLSFLRMEDQYCYIATLLDTLAELEKDTDATVPFDYLTKMVPTERLDFVNGNMAGLNVY